MKSFQTILLIVFSFFVVIAVLIFAGVFGGSKGADQVATTPVVMWGTIPKIVIDDIVLQTTEAGDKLNITYVEKRVSELESDLINALASGIGPDILLAPHTLLLKQQDKLLAIPFTSIPERTYKDTFVQASETLLSTDYSLGMPVFLNPLVLYWNRDMFNSAGVPAVPANWSAVQLLPTKMTKIDDKGKITTSAVAMGGVGNVTHYKEILATQIMQTGNQIVGRDRVEGEGGVIKLVPRVGLNEGTGAVSALRYYVEFGNPSLPKYSWNSAKNNSLDEFVAGKLGMYFGFASEESRIREQNPHLNFDIANMPQITDGDLRLTYADVYTLAVIKSSKVTAGAFAVAYKLAYGTPAKLIADTLRLPPARRDLLATLPVDATMSLFFNSAVMARTWYDTDEITTGNIFADMVEDVMIGKTGTDNAISTADARLRQLFK